MPLPTGASLPRRHPHLDEHQQWQLEHCRQLESEHRPGPGDSAVITNPGSYTVTLDVKAALDRLTLGGASGTQTHFASSRSLVLSGASAINNNGINVLVSSTLAGTGTLTNQGTLNADNSTINTALINQGLLVFRGNASLGGLVDNQAGATLRVQADGSFAGTATLTVANGFTNNGKIELTSAVDAEQATLNVNSGSLVNGPGGWINVLAGTGGGRALGAELDNRGTVTIDQGLTLNGSSAHHLNSGTITLSGGKTFQINGATFQVDLPGILQGDGTLNVASTLFTNNGIINPGNPAGVLSIIGAYPQTSKGVVNIEIGGRTAGVDYDQLSITDHATLDGTLNVRLTNGFRPNAGDSFEVIRYGSHTGSFDHIVGLIIDAGFFFQPLFSATNVVLTTTDTRSQIVFDSAKVLSGGHVEFTLGGTAGQDFVIEAATNLPSATWIPVLTNIDSGANFNFLITDVTNSPQRYFRISQ